jgi:hypothetical protein
VACSGAPPGLPGEMAASACTKGRAPRGRGTADLRGGARRRAGHRAVLECRRASDGANQFADLRLFDPEWRGRQVLPRGQDGRSVTSSVARTRSGMRCRRPVRSRRGRTRKGYAAFRHPRIGFDTDGVLAPGFPEPGKSRSRGCRAGRRELQPRWSLVCKAASMTVSQGQLASALTVCVTASSSAEPCVRAPALRRDPTTDPR